MDIISILDDYGISRASAGHKHSRPGWINMPCPFCEGSPGYHLGYSLQDNYFRCWRCGWKSQTEAISKLCGVTKAEAIQVIKLHHGRVSLMEGATIPRTIQEFKLPSSVGPLLPHHKKYLQGRNFAPEQLEKDWGLLSTSPTSTLAGAEYKHRILAPIVWEGQMVSFQARDVSGQSPLKYKACPSAQELIPHKRILYGNENNWHGFGIVVEGITDVWRFGGPACAVFGIAFTPAQVKLLAQIFDDVAVVFDDEPQAQFQARKLATELQFRGVRARSVMIQGDPGGMAQGEADELTQEILNTKGGMRMRK